MATVLLTGRNLRIGTATWNADPDSDGIINLLDYDSDNDGSSDYYEYTAGTDPASPPAVMIYEDAENGDTAGWSVYDADPAGAIISNVFDAVRLSQGHRTEWRRHAKRLQARHEYRQ